MQFLQATKEKSFLRMGLVGPAGSGKSYTALRFAHALGEDIAVLDSEHGSASKYVGEAPDGVPWSFDILEPDSFEVSMISARAIMLSSSSTRPSLWDWASLAA